MHKRKRSAPLLYVFFLIVLFFLLLVPLLFPVLGFPDAQGYDYVDNNTSDVDASPDKGTHSNFTAQQYYPDSVYDTLTEENTGEAFSLEDFVDNNTSDVDNSLDIGTHSNFENERLKDGIYDILTESGAVGEIIRDGVTQGQDVSATVTFSHTLGYSSGNNRLVVVAAGFEHSSGDINIGSATYNGQSMTKIVQATSGGTGYVASVALFYLLDSNLPSSSGSYSVVVTADSNPNADLWACAVSYIEVKQEAPDDYDSDSSGSSTTMTSELNCEDGSMLVQACAVGATGSFAPSWGTTEVIEDSDINSASAVFNEKLGQNSGARDLGCTQGAMNRGAWVGACWAPAGGDADYDLNIEVQFTTVIDFLETEKLCIYMGTMGAEDLNVSYWTGSSWIELDSDLTAASWNNYTVSLTSSTFTIRFETETAIGDDTADEYQVDAVLLCVEGAGSKEDSVDADDSNVDDSVDVGTLSSFDNMKTKDGMATLTEGLSRVWTNNTQPASLILETDPDISGSAVTYETYGLNNLVSDDSTYGGGDVQDCGTVNDPQEVSLIMEFDYSELGISGSEMSYLRFEAEAYFIGGTGRAPATDPWEMENTFYNGSVEIYNWDLGSWEIMGTVFIDDPADLSLWDSTGDSNPERSLVRSKGSGFSGSHMSSTGFIRIRIQMTGVFQGTAYDGCSVIDYVDVDLQYGGGDDFLLDQEVQWTDLPYQLPNEELCIYGGTMGSEGIKVQAWNGTGWETVFTDLSPGWNNASVTDWLTGSIFTVRFMDVDESGDTTQDQWQIDIALIRVWTAVNYELDLEAQWTNAAYTQTYEELCIYGGTMGSENLRVDVWTGSTWHNLFTDLSSGWNNVSVTDYLTSSTFTIRFKGGTETGDTSLDIWEIDCTLLHTWGVQPIANFSYTPEYPYTGETVTFNASDSYDPDGSIVSYFWDFGDGANGTGEITTHTYDDDGTYTVVLTVTDNDGLSDITSRGITVLNRPPIATFTESAETVYTGETIYFNASDSYDPDGTIVNYFWAFGDGSNASGVTVDHAYADDGTYTVTLTVTDDDGATDTANATKTVLNRAPVAVFTESATTVFTGEVIYFDAFDSYDPDGYIVGYFWDFGDGTNATGVVVDHAYADDGNYTVTLTVTDDDDVADTATSTKTVLNRPPVASFTESGETVYTAEVITFNASASYDPDGYIVSYFWDFSDGTNTTGVIVGHSYVDDGVYTVTLTVTDDDGASASASAVKTILNRPPIAAFTESAETVLTGEIIMFNASESYDPDGTIASQFWSFGDGSNATGVIVPHSYIDDGVYTVTLTVTDDDGATDTANATKTVLNRPPVALFIESAETVYTAEVITFNASDSYDPDGIIVSYFWDFGDGTNATGVIVEHAYATNGTFIVTLTVTDDDGATGSSNATKTILYNEPPIAIFTESAETVYTGETITFNASDSYDPDGSIVSYLWDFGDGSNATGIVVEHSYIDDGNYTVTLAVTDDKGAIDTTTATKTVLNRHPVANFTESAETVYTGETIYFNASDSYDPDGSIVSYFWDFGDGTNAAGIIVDHAYADDGVYNVTLTVTDDDGATASATATKTILNKAPISIFTESAETVYTGETIYFNASDSYDPDGSIVSYFWDFGDGANATGATISHAYADDGIYTITLTVTDDDGATDTTTSTKTVLNRSPVAIFSETAETVYTGETITFNATDSYDPDGSIVSYFWDFGDGTNATGSIVEHEYVDDGVYTVTLSVTDNDGATASTSANKTILNRPPAAIFTESTTIALTNEIITFNASESYDSDGSIVSYFWDFGDGTNDSGVIVDHSYIDDGTYTVTLIVTDDDGETALTSTTKTILNRPPVAVFTESAETVYTGEAVAFNASGSYDPDGSIVSYLWDFGDGTNATGVTTEHAYADYGNYTVTLTVTDNDGATATAIKTIMVKDYPIADFTYDPVTPYVNQTVTFNASISDPKGGVIVSYFWAFGDGSQLNETNPVTTHIYTTVGNYTVTLTVTDSEGLNDTTSKIVTVVEVPPVANFTYTPTSPAVNQTVTFDASESYDPNGYIVNYVWNFGDGNVTSTTDPMINHKYVTAGNYLVRLMVADNDGLTDTTSQDIILGNPSIANFTYTPEYPYVGDVVTFDASLSTANNGTIVSYVWDFGDGSPLVNETDPITTHVYTKAENYTIALTITDDYGLTGTVTKPITVQKAPIANFTYSPTSPKTFVTITFNASASYDPNGYIVSYVWDFGDGNVTTVTTPTITHYYAAAENYAIVLIVSDNGGYTDSTAKDVTILPRPPTADYIFTPGFPIVGETVTFNASQSYDVDGTIANYTWDFGDGNLTTTMNPITTHTYITHGNCTVILVVTDHDGLADNKMSTVGIRDYPTANVTVSPEIPALNRTSTFDASLSTPNGGVIVSYVWDFGDGSPILNTTDPVSTHIYTTVGNYTVTLTVSDSEGLNDTASKMVEVIGKPIASFTYSPSDPYVGDTITFNASESYDMDGYIVRYLWDFGDGSPILNTTDLITAHTYSTGVSYEVVLTVLDNEGFIDTKSLTISVNKAPFAVLTYSPEFPIVGDIVTFNASQSYDVRRSIANYTWDFGDGNLTTTMNPITTHIYATEGNYMAKLIVTDTGGYSDTCIKTITIRNYPIANFVLSPDPPIKDEITIFNASSSDPRGGTISIYVWDFGDGTKLNTTNRVTNHTFTAFGEYNVSLTVIDSEGLTNTTSKIMTVRDYPTAVFSYSPTYPTAGSPAIFNASSSTAGQGFITSYAWNFGDGNVTTLNSTGTIHVYSKAGNYNVTLTITDSEGLTDSATRLIIVQQALPVAYFNYSPDPPLKGATVTFDASESYDPDGTFLAYYWRFGDGETDLTWEPVITHIYGETGEYNVSLTLEDVDKNRDVTWKIITVTSGAYVDFTWSPDYPKAGEIVTFDASESYAVEGEIVSYTWDFGDGNVTSISQQTILHKYVAKGNYTATLNVTDSYGAWNIKSKLITIIAPRPHAEFIWAPSNPYVNETIILNASASTPAGGVIVSYAWDFGDGDVANVSDPILYHTYLSEGNYTLTLNVTDSYGLWSTLTKMIGVLPAGGPIANFTWSPVPSYPNRTITFDTSASIPGWNGTSRLPLVSYTWNFSDGNITTVSMSTIDHIFVQAGNYTVTLNVTDSAEQSDTIFFVVEIRSTLLGDVNGDGKVRVDDVLAVALAFGLNEGDPEWDPRCDLNGDGGVRVDDVLIVALQFGEEL